MVGETSIFNSIRAAATEGEKNMEDEQIKDVVDSFVEILAHLCVVLTARGIMTEYDRQYVCGVITSEEWTEKFKAEQDPINLFKGLFGDDLFGKGEN